MLWLFITTSAAFDEAIFMKRVRVDYRTPVLRKLTGIAIGYHQRQIPFRYFECQVYLTDCNIQLMTSFKAGSGSFGGAVHIHRGELRAQNCQIVHCNSVCGGGIFLLSATSVLTECNFTDTNATQQGGGLAVVREIGDDSDLFCMLIDSSINYCKAGGDGGGVLATDISELVIQNSQFFMCEAKGGGGGLLVSDCQAYLSSVLMHLNSAGSSAFAASSHHGKSHTPHYHSGGGAIWLMGEEDGCVMMTEGCCFIGNRCLIPDNTLPGQGFDVRVSGAMTKYCSYGDRFWNLENVSVKHTDAMFIHQTTRWYGNYEKFIGANSGACAAYIAYLDESLIITAPEYSVDIGNVPPTEHIEQYDDIVETSVPVNTPGRTPVPRATDKGRTQVITQAVTFTLSRVSYRLITSFTPTAIFTRSSEFTKTDGFTATGGFANSKSFSGSAAFSESSAFQQSRAFKQTDAFTATDGFSTSKGFDNTGAFSATNGFLASNTYSLSNEFSESNAFTGSNAFKQSAAFSATSGFQDSRKFDQTREFSETNAFTRSKPFSASDIFTESSSFTASDPFTASEIFSQSRVFSQSSGFDPTSTFSPMMTRTPPPEYLSIMKSLVGSTTLSASVTVSEVHSYVQELLVVTTLGADGRVIDITTMIEKMTVLYAAVQVPVYIVTQSQVEFLTELSDAPGLGISTPLLIGMISGIALVTVMVLYMVVWFVRHRNDANAQSYSDNSDYDIDHYVDDEVVENVVNGHGTLWDDEKEDVEDWLNTL